MGESRTDVEKRRGEEAESFESEILTVETNVKPMRRSKKNEKIEGREKRTKSSLVSLDYVISTGT